MCAPGRPLQVHRTFAVPAREDGGMTPDDARRLVDEMVLVAEAELTAKGWRFLTVDGLTFEDPASADLYDQAITMFQEVVGTGHLSQHYGTSSGLTFAVLGGDADDLIRVLRERLELLSPPDPAGGRWWTFRESMP